MKFKSRKDLFFQILTLVPILLLPVLYFYSTFQSLLVPCIGTTLLVWIYFGTKYELSEDELIYKSGPLKGKIEIAKIREIIVGKTLWSGMKPATARNGLIIKYNNWDEIYISPESNEFFVDEILKRNQEVTINKG